MHGSSHARSCVPCCILGFSAASSNLKYENFIQYPCNNNNKCLLFIRFCGKQPTITWGETK
jgi:hypothetical protein